MKHSPQRPFSWVDGENAQAAMRCHLLGEGATHEGGLRSQAQLTMPPLGHLGPSSNVNNKNILSSSQLPPWDSLGDK